MTIFNDCNMATEARSVSQLDEAKLPQLSGTTCLPLLLHTFGDRLASFQMTGERVVVFFCGSNKTCHLSNAKIQQGKCFAMAKTHKYYPEAGENSHFSFVEKILEIGLHSVPNDNSRIWFENLTCLWTDTRHPNVLQMK
jgi:hypothetical protein